VRSSTTESELIVEVIDTGPGLNEKQLTHIFEPYYSTERRYKQTSGLGLGLPLSKMLVELHGGHIWANNLSDGGVNIGFRIQINEVVAEK
jgi:signal transduction histidine kinase